MFNVFQVFIVLFDMILLIKVVSSLDIWWNLVNTDTGGTCHGVRIKWVNFRENIRAFFLLGQIKLSALYGCL